MSISKNQKVLSGQVRLNEAAARYRQYKATEQENPYKIMSDGYVCYCPSLLHDDLIAIADAYIRYEQWVKEWIDSLPKKSGLPEATP